jgi:hypothetical protein
MYDATGEMIAVNAAISALLRTLLRRSFRYLIAGHLFSFIAAIGFLLCILLGIMSHS